MKLNETNSLKKQFASPLSKTFGNILFFFPISISCLSCSSPWSFIQMVTFLNRVHGQMIFPKAMLLSWGHSASFTLTYSRSFRSTSNQSFPAISSTQSDLYTNALGKNSSFKHYCKCAKRALVCDALDGLCGNSVHPRCFSSLQELYGLTQPFFHKHGDAAMIWTLFHAYLLRLWIAITILQKEDLHQ